MSPIRSLAFVINAQKTGAPEIANDLMTIARDVGVKVTQIDDFPIPDNALDGQDACCVIGGDGTLLGIAPAAARAAIPLIGVNRGSLGFLTTFSAEEARQDFAAILSGDYHVAERALLDCTTAPDQHDLALNDVLIKDEQHSRLIELSVYADDEFVTTYTCDGLIFSTPAGSTAYNLSAGGPLIHPGAQVIALTPICPHTLSNRSIIFHQDVKLRVTQPKENSGALVAVDGQRNLRICEGGQIDITVASPRLKLIHRAGYEHFSAVRTKLKWSGGVKN